MSEPKKFYGMENTERLEFDDPDEVVDRYLDDAVNTPGESFDSVAERLAFPIEVCEYEPMEIPDAQDIANSALEHALENLDEEYGDPDGDNTEPTEAMKAAALSFGRAVVADYVPWACEQTGKVIEYTREQCREIYGPAEPAPEKPASKCEHDWKTDGTAKSVTHLYCRLCGASTPAGEAKP